DFDVKKWVETCYEVMNDDLNTPMLIAQLFEAAGFINEVNDGKKKIGIEGLALIREKMKEFIEDILGLKDESASDAEVLEPVIDLVIKLRQQARESKDFKTSDQIRDGL